MQSNQTLKFVIGWTLCLLFRLIPGRPPNVETILAVQMPFGKHLGAGSGFVFGFLSIVLFDIFTGRVGMWTVITSIAYGGLGVWAARYFRQRSGVRHYALFAVAATILYDAVTGLTIGPIFFHQPFMAALLGQIPFTLYHLAGNVLFAVALSPLVERLIVSNKKLEIPITLPFRQSVISN